MEIGCWLRENLRKMRCFFRWGHWIVRYIVEEGRRERAGGGGEIKKKGTLVSLFYFIVCVLVCRKRRVYTYLHYLPGSRDTYLRARGTFSTCFFCFAIITYLEYFGNLPYICSRRTVEERRRFLFQELLHTMSGLEECRHLEKPSKVQFAGSWYVFALSTSRVD